MEGAPDIGMLLHISVVQALLKALARQGEGFLVSGVLRVTDAAMRFTVFTYVIDIIRALMERFYS